jgi:S-ribosylhomocysteine lyase
MVNVNELGWDTNTVGELDHRLLKAPHVKLRSSTEGVNGDVVYAIDIRINPPNVRFLNSTEMHSMEHFLLAGFLKWIPQTFISIGLMGCQTGYYLVLLNEGNAEKICAVIEQILDDILIADEVPFVSPMQCGNFKNHSLEMAQNLARRLLAEKSNWRQVI